MEALLLDADGVVLKKDEYFSERFAREYQVPIETITPFFKGPLRDCQVGKVDLKKVIAPYLRGWQWKGSVDDFLDYWFEDVVVNDAITPLLKACRAREIKCYLASNNEHYRARKIEVVLGTQLDGYFFSADLKIKKDNPDYFRAVLIRLSLPASAVLFFDNEEKNVAAARECGLLAELYNEDAISKLLTS